MLKKIETFSCWPRSQSNDKIIPLPPQARDTPSNSSLHSLPLTSITPPPVISLELPPNSITYTDTKLGQTGYTRVMKGEYKKNQSAQSQPVAIKKFLDTQGVDTEIRLFNHLKINGDHPHIVNIIGYIKNNSIMVMELVDGMDLLAWLYRNPRNLNNNIEKAHHIALDILKGLIYLHSIRVIHLDIKPENILIDEQSRAKICDFDKAQIIPEGKSEILAREVGGTLRYASPEHFKRINNFSHINTSTDIYSFGLVLILCMENTGYLLYGNKDAKALADIGRNGKLPPIPEEIQPETSALILHCLKFNKDERPTALQAHERLEKITEARFKG